MKAKLFTLLTTLLLSAASAWAQPYPTESYILSDDKKTLEKWFGSETTIDMTKDNNLRNITSIGTFCFYNKTEIQSLTLATGITSIGHDAFNNCIKLTSLVIPSGVKIIEQWVFSDCDELTRVTLPAGITEIKSNSFWQCKKLTTLELPAELTTIGGAAFLGSGLTAITIPAKVTTIESGAFMRCTNIAYFSVATGNSSFEVSNNVLFTKGKKKLLAYPPAMEGASYDIPAEVTTIESGAFGGNNRLTTITIPASVSSIGEYAFVACSNLSSITVEPSNQDYESADGVLFSKGKETVVAYPSGKEFTAYSIPQGVKEIEKGAFAVCNKLTTVIIPSSVKIIGGSAFATCEKLTSIAIPEGVTTIDEDTFSDCSNLTDVTLPKSISAINNSAFADCENLAAITLPVSLTLIKPDAFSGCTKLNMVNATACTKLNMDSYYQFPNKTDLTVYVATEAIKNQLTNFTKTKVEAPSPLYTVAFNVTGNASGMLTVKAKGAAIPSGATVPSSWDVTFAATGGKVKAWTITGGTLTGTDTDANRTITSLSSNAVVTVEFEQVFRTVTYSVVGNVGGTLSAKGNGAGISSGAQINDGGSVAFTATPADGYKLKVWTATGATLSGSNTDAIRTIAAISADATVTVGFEKIPTAVETTTQNNVAVRSNPFTSELTLDNATQVIRYTVMNMLGQPVISGANNGLSTLTIDGTRLPNGVYLLVLQTTSGKHTVRVVKGE